MCTKLDGKEALSCLSQEQKAFLSQEQEALVAEYYSLVKLPALSDRDADRVVEIWEMAGTSELLLSALEAIDDRFVSSEGNKESLADNVNARAFLSEYLSECADKILKQQEQSDRLLPLSEVSKVVLLCPDGSGYVLLPENITAKTLGELGEQFCFKCKRSFAEHGFSIMGGRDPVGAT